LTNKVEVDYIRDFESVVSRFDKQTTIRIYVTSAKDGYSSSAIGRAKSSEYHLLLMNIYDLCQKEKVDEIIENLKCQENYITFNPNLLEEAYTRAKVFENAYKQNSVQTAYTTPTVFYSPYSFSETPNLNLTNQRRPLSRSRSENFTPSTITCFTCGRTGHYSRNCPDLSNNRNSSANNQPP
ncbi:17879_t:CDS:2, partial [Racocetra persica]